MNHLWLLIPLTPLLAAAALLVFGQRARHGLWLACLPALLGLLLMPGSVTPSFLWPAADWGAHTYLHQGLLAGSTILWLCAGLFSMESLRSDPRRVAYQVFWLLSLSGNLLWLIAGDALSFYVGFSLMSLSAYGLIVHNQTMKARRAGRLYLQLAILGELLLLTGLMLAWHESGGSFLFRVWREAELSGLTLSTLILGLGLKAGFWPLHVWLPLAHPAAPAAASAVLSGAMIKAGIAGLWLMLPAESAILQQWSIAVLMLGLVSLFYGAVLGLLRADAKETLALSSVSQMGYLLFITALAWHAPELRPALIVVVTLYAVHHGLAKGSLFMAAGLIHWARPASALPRAAMAAGMVLPALAIGGLPFTTGAAVKTALKDQLPAAGLDSYTYVLQAGAIASTLVMLRALWLLYQRSTSAPSRGKVPLLSVFGWSVPAGACILLPWLWPPMRAAALDSLAIYKLVDLSWPIAAATVLALMAWRWQWQAPGRIGQGNSPALLLSIYVRRKVQRPPIPAPDPEELPPRRRTRKLERRWNHWWPQSTINNSIWLLLAVLLVGSLFMNL